MRRWLKRITVGVVALGLVAGAAYGGAWLVTASRVSQVFASTTAADMCAGVFISGRTKDAVYEQSFPKKPPKDRIYSSLDIDIDHENGFVRVDNWLSTPVTAVYAGLERGCVLLPEGETGAQLAQAPQVKPQTAPSGNEVRWTTRVDLPEGVDAAKLDAAIAANFADPAHNTHSFLVYYDGQLLREVYRGHAGPEIPAESWSLGKTLVGALAGRLIFEDKLALDEKIAIGQWPDANDPRRQITVRNLLHMASGLDFSVEAQFVPVFEQSDHGLIYTNLADVMAFSADQPLARPPGTLGDYNNGDVLLLLEHIRQKLKLSHSDLLDLIEEKVLNPLNMESVRLSTDFAGNPVITGYVYGSARDWSKLALVYAGRGEANGYRLFSEDFFDFIRQPSPNYPEQAYGGMIWLNNHSYYNAPKDALVMSGAGDQVAIIAPEEKLVIVRMGHLNKSETMFETYNTNLAEIFAAFDNAAPTTGG